MDHGVGWERDDAASERAGREHCTTAKTARHLLFPHEVLLVCQSQNSCRHARLNLRANRAVRCGGVRISTARVRRTRWELDARTRSRAPDWGSGELFEGVSDASRLPSWEKGKSNPHQVSALITRLEVLPPPFVVPRDVLEHGGRATLTKLLPPVRGDLRGAQENYRQSISDALPSYIQRSARGRTCPSATCVQNTRVILACQSAVEFPCGNPLGPRGPPPTPRFRCAPHLRSVIKKTSQ